MFYFIIIHRFVEIITIIFNKMLLTGVNTLSNK